MRYTGRLSVVVHPPAALAGGMLAALERLPASHRPGAVEGSGGVEGSRGLGPHRVLRGDELHLNLVYVGEVSTKELRAVEESVERGSRGIRPFELRPTAIIGIPLVADHAGEPKQLAVALDAPSGLLELQKRLAMRLARPRKDGKKPRFLPHVTVVRMHAGATCGHVEQVWGEVGPEFMWPVEEVLLVENLEGGADRVLAKFALEG